MRIRKKPWADEEMALAAGTLLPGEPGGLKGRWRVEFGNNGPIHIELGCGKGRFINTLAPLNPGVNFVAVEKEPLVCVMALKLARLGGNPPNLRFIIADVRELSDYFEAGEVSRIYMNFPDPWHRKKRWIRRRLTHGDFLAIYETLCPNCELFLKTDNAVFFDFSLAELTSRGWLIENVTRDLRQSGAPNVVTEYEEKFNAEGVPIMRLEAYFHKKTC